MKCIIIYSEVDLHEKIKNALIEHGIKTPVKFIDNYETPIGIAIHNHLIHNDREDVDLLINHNHLIHNDREDVDLLINHNHLMNDKVDVDLLIEGKNNIKSNHRDNSPFWRTFDNRKKY